MELRELRCFVALADELNFTRAAERCFITQQAMSSTIARLERRLCTRLVYRRPRGCDLTGPGVRLAAAARMVVAEADALSDLVAVGGGRRHPDMLRLGVLGFLQVPLITAALTALRVTLPGRVHVRAVGTEEQWLGLLADRLDAVLSPMPVDLPWCRRDVLVTQERVIALAAGSELADAGSLRQIDLEGLAVGPAGTAEPPGFDAFYSLDPDGDRRRVAVPFVEDPLTQFTLAVSFGTILTAPASWSALLVDDALGLTARPLIDVEPVPLCLLTREDDDRPEVTTLRGAVRRVLAVPGSPTPAGGERAPTPR